MQMASYLQGFMQCRRHVKEWINGPYSLELTKTKASSGVFQAILTKLLLNMRKVEEECDLKNTWRILSLHWKTMALQTWDGGIKSSLGLTGTRTTKKRLDREVANRLWMEEFDCSRVQVLLSSRSNHQPIIITTRGKYSGKKGRKLFRFEAKWALDKEGE